MSVSFSYGARAYNGIWGQSPQRGQSPVRGSGAMNLKALLPSDVQRTQQICTLGPFSIFSLQQVVATKTHENTIER